MSRNSGCTLLQFPRAPDIIFFPNIMGKDNFYDKSEPLCKNQFWLQKSDYQSTAVEGLLKSSDIREREKTKNKIVQDKIKC